jgi:hypothetical protein
MPDKAREDKGLRSPDSNLCQFVVVFLKNLGALSPMSLGHLQNARKLAPVKHGLFPHFRFIQALINPEP